MKILFVGVFHTNWSTHHPMVRELKKQNHKVFKFDFREIALKFNKIRNPIYSKTFRKYFNDFINLRPYLPERIRNLKYYLFGNWMMNKFLLHIIKNNQFDLVFFGKTDTVNYNLIPEINKFSKTWYFFMDPLKRTFGMNIHKYASLSTWSSATFSSVNYFFKKKGANSYFITQGMDKEVFKPRKKDNGKEIDVIFVGRKTPKRKKYIDFLRKNNVNIVCYGSGWNNKPIYLKELVEKYQKSKIVLNFTKGNIGFSIRVFQVIGTGSFLMSEYCSDLESLFKKAIHLEWFKTKEEMLELIKYYLKNETDREKIAHDGYRYTQVNYSWEKIMDRIIKIVTKK